MITRESLIEDFSPFCDIGEPIPKVTHEKDNLTLRMTRNGDPLRITINVDSGKATSITDGRIKRNFASLEALLSSDIFANLKKWTDSQRDYLKRELNNHQKLLPLNGTLNKNQKITNIDEISSAIGNKDYLNKSTEILLIDGPAGIGKTSLIEQLSLKRAESYKDLNLPPVLHVKSRGRALSNLQDLMAFSLQTIRSHITYDQIPVLVKYGLVILAIDGFDELGDPNGYDLAWAQLGELVNQVRGKGVIILAGRDTFLGRDRLYRDVKSIKKNVDTVNSVTLFPPTVAQAKEWLQKRNWTVANLDSPAMAILLESDSFALRPVFLKLLGEITKPKQILEKHDSYIATMLIQSMITRESEKFGRPAEAALSIDGLKNFVWNFMCEIAREMADSQSESVEANFLGWVAEVALGDDIEGEMLAIIKNRASVIGFLVPDERPGYLRFMHSQIMNFFLSYVTINSIKDGETPKYIRRNLIGPDFLSSFLNVALEIGSNKPQIINEFLSRAIYFSSSYSYIDRGIKNVGALILSALPAYADDSEILIRDYEIDDAICQGTYPRCIIERSSVSQLDCRGADLKLIEFKDSKIISVIADDTSRFSATFPLPAFITDGTGREIPNSEIEEWLSQRGRNNDETSLDGIVPAKLKKHPIYSLLGRACRLKQYWLRLEDDVYSEKILRNPNWDKLRLILIKYDLLKEERRAASGRSPTFYHIKHRDRILAENPNDEEISAFFKELANTI